MNSINSALMAVIVSTGLMAADAPIVNGWSDESGQFTAWGTEVHILDKKDIKVLGIFKSDKGVKLIFLSKNQVLVIKDNALVGGQWGNILSNNIIGLLNFGNSEDAASGVLVDGNIKMGMNLVDYVNVFGERFDLPKDKSYFKIKITRNKRVFVGSFWVADVDAPGGIKSGIAYLNSFEVMPLEWGGFSGDLDAQEIKILDF